MIQILFEDNHLLVCVKPPGILSQAGDKDLEDMLTIGKAYLKEKYAKPGDAFLGLVHRLDLNVGGIMVFAKTSKCAARLFESIKNKDFQKRYLAVVEGKLPLGKKQILEDFLSKDEELRISIDSNEESGKKAVLEYLPVESTSFLQHDITLVEVDLYTGRFHQIRKQFSLRNMPLVGDTKYGSNIKYNPIALWAYQLSFPHPTSKEWMTFESLPSTSIFTRFKFESK